MVIESVGSGGQEKWCTSLFTATSANGLGFQAVSGRDYCEITMKFPMETVPKWNLCGNRRTIISMHASRVSFWVGRQVVNVPSFMVRADSHKHIDLSLTSPFGGGRLGRVKRNNQKAAAKKASGGDGDEDDGNTRKLHLSLS